MQGAGKQQETQDAMQHGFIEINAVQHDGHFIFDVNAEGAKQDQKQREGQRDQHNADGGRQFQETVVDVAEYG